MCEYCNGRVPLLKNNHSEFEVFIVNKDVIDMYFWGSEQEGNDSIEINYCPMCGREL